MDNNKIYEYDQNIKFPKIKSTTIDNRILDDQNENLTKILINNKVKNQIDIDNSLNIKSISNEKKFKKQVISKDLSNNIN